MTAYPSKKPRGLRWSLAASPVLAIVASLTLSGCGALSLEHHLWESRLDSAPGVEVASWRYSNNWPSSGPRYTADITVSPTLSEAEAKEIARLSCQGSPRFDDVTVTSASSGTRGDTDTDTGADTGTETGADWEARLYGLSGSCFNPQHLQDFTRVLGAMGSSGSDLVGEVDARVFDPADGELNGIDEYTLHLTAETTSTRSLFTLLREIRTHTSATPLEIEAWVDDDGRTLTNFGVPLRATLPVGYDPAAAFNILERAYDLPHQGIAFSPAGISITPGSVGMLRDPSTLQLQAESIEAGISFTVLPPQNSTSDQKENEAYGALLLQLAEVPGVAEVHMPAPEQGTGTRIIASELSAIPEVLRVIQTSETAGAEFYVTDVQDTMFVRVQRGAQHTNETVEAFEQMIRAQGEIPSAGYAALIVQKDGIRMRFDLLATATQAELNGARAELLRLLETSPIDEVSLYPPSPFPSEDLGG